MPQVLDLKTLEDLKVIQKAIQDNEDFTIGEIAPLTYTLKLNGGRFENYDISYVDATIAKIILSHQKNYDKLVKELEKKTKVKFPNEEKLLKFKIEEGSLELISEILGLDEVAKRMESKHLLYLLVVVAMLWTGHSAYTQTLEHEIRELELKKEVKLRQLDGREKENYKEMVDKALDTMKDVLNDKSMQDAINTPKKETLSLLEDNETLSFTDETLLTSLDEDRYTYQKPEIEDKEVILDFKPYNIESYNFYQQGKLFKLVGLAKLVNSEIISTDDRIKIIQKAEKREPVKLKLKLIKDGVTKRTKNAYIIEADLTN